MPNIEALFLLVVGLFIGTVFTVGMSYWNAPLERDDAQEVTATYSSYHIDYGYGRNRRYIHEVELQFTDHDELRIEGSCISEEVKNAIKELPVGAELDMLLHPNSSSIVELKHGEKTILPFEEAVKDLGVERIGFLILGILLYLCAACGAFVLLKRWILKVKNQRKLIKELVDLAGKQK